MSSDQLVPALMFMTIGVVLLFAVVQLMSFLRKRKNREAAKNVLTD